MRRLADAGYYAIAPDLFHRSGAGCVVEYGDFAKVMEYFKDVSGDESILTDIAAALDHLHGAGFADQSIGVVGFCFGGRVSFLVALRYALGAAVGFYGGGIVTGRFPQFPPLVAEAAALQTPWLGLFGDQDASIPVEDLELQVMKDVDELRRRREEYLADRDLDELLEATNARRRARGLPERTREEVQREFGRGASGASRVRD